MSKEDDRVSSKRERGEKKRWDKARKNDEAYQEALVEVSEGKRSQKKKGGN